METCIFCRIVSGELPSERVYEDDTFIVIKDIKPQAPVHLLFITKQHIASFASLFEGGEAVLTALLSAVQSVTCKLGLESFRLLTNIGSDAGQTVHHLHWHLLAGAVLDE